MLNQSLGLIEVKGLTTAIEAADAAVKSANVELIGYELTKGGGWVTVKIQGNVSAVEAAIQAACSAASSVGEVIAMKVIPRPGDGLDVIVSQGETVGAVPEKTPLALPAEEERLSKITENTKPAAKKAEAKKEAPKKEPAKKADIKKEVPKKEEAKREEAKKPIPKQVENKKEAPKKAAVNQEEAQKPAPMKAEVKNAEGQNPELKAEKSELTLVEFNPTVAAAKPIESPVAVEESTKKS